MIRGDESLEASVGGRSGSYGRTGAGDRVDGWLGSWRSAGVIAAAVRQ
jgi:hypothetical protein